MPTVATVVGSWPRIRRDKFGNRRLGRTGSFAAHADPSSPAAWIEFQSVSVETSPPFPKDVNRATWLVEGKGMRRERREGSRTERVVFSLMKFSSFFGYFVDSFDDCCND